MIANDHELKVTLDHRYPALRISQEPVSNVVSQSTFMDAQ